MDKVYRLLQEIRKRPGLYLGKPSIERLGSFLDGYYHYEFELNGMCEPDCLVGFREYIQKKYELRTPHDWVNVIQCFSYSEQDALDIFYKALDQYLQNPLEYMEAASKLLWTDTEKSVKAQGNIICIYKRKEGTCDIEPYCTLKTKESIVPIHHKTKVEGDWLFVYRIDEAGNQGELVEKINISIK